MYEKGNFFSLRIFRILCIFFKVKIHFHYIFYQNFRVKSIIKCEDISLKKEKEKKKKKKEIVLGEIKLNIQVCKQD